MVWPLGPSRNCNILIVIKNLIGLIKFRTYLLFGTLISNEVRNVVFEQVDALFGCIFVIDLEVTSSSDA